MFTAILVLLASAASAAPGGFDVYADGARLHRLEGKPGKEVAVTYRRSDDGGRTWSKPVRVDGGRPAYRFGAGDARVVAEGDEAFAIWALPGEGPHGSGPLAVARSTDAGRTWTAAASPSGDGSFGRRFPALAVSSGVLHAVWLDRASNSKVMASRSVDGARSWSKPAVLDADACECCWNSALAADDGRVYALFRGRNPRDMSVAASADRGRSWGKPAVAGPFGWGFNGCPHVGGALALSDEGVAALVWTGREEKAGLYAFTSPDGKEWGAAAKLGGAGAKHADLAGNAGALAAVWDDDGAIWAATRARGGAWSVPRRLSGKKKSSHPRVAAAGAGFRAFWTEGSVYAGAMLE